MSSTITPYNNTTHLETAILAAKCFQSADSSKAMTIFSSNVPKEIRDGVYGELYPLKHFHRDYFGCAEHAFHNQNGQMASLEKKAQAIYNYFLRCLIDLFKKNDPKAAMVLFSKLPEEVRNSIYCELFHIVRFATPYFGCGEHAFHDLHDQHSTSDQKVKAIETYLKYTVESRMMTLLPLDVKTLILQKLKSDDISLRILRHVSTWFRNKISVPCKKPPYRTQLEAVIDSKTCNRDDELCSELAFRGHLKLLQWARANHCRWDWTTCAMAARGGHLEVLQWVNAERCQMREGTCQSAASNGHLEVLQWARAHGCPWDKWTCYVAALGGHWKVLQWAIANGCPWDKNAIRERAKDHPAVLEWLNSQNN
jgi:hypothetical protein